MEECDGERERKRKGARERPLQQPRKDEGDRLPKLVIIINVQVFLTGRKRWCERRGGQLEAFRLGSTRL